jgi:hypothetical protein
LFENNKTIKREHVETKLVVDEWDKTSCRW